MFLMLTDQLDTLVFIHAATLLAITYLSFNHAITGRNQHRFSWIGGWAILHAARLVIRIPSLSGVPLENLSTLSTLSTILLFPSMLCLVEASRPHLLAEKRWLAIIIFHGITLGILGASLLAGQEILIVVVKGLVILFAASFVINLSKNRQMMDRPIAIAVIAVSCALYISAHVLANTSPTFPIVLTEAVRAQEIPLFLIQIAAALGIAVGILGLTKRENNPWLRHRNTAFVAISCLLFLGSAGATILVAKSLNHLTERQTNQFADIHLRNEKQHLTAFVSQTRAVADSIRSFPFLAEALNQPPEQTNPIHHRLKQLCRPIEPAICYLMDATGTVVGTSNTESPYSLFKNNYAFRTYFKEAINKGSGEQLAQGVTTNIAGYYASTAIRPTEESDPQGVLVVKRDLPVLALGHNDMSKSHLVLSGVDGQIYVSTLSPQDLKTFSIDATEHSNLTISGIQYSMHSDKISGTPLRITHLFVKHNSKVRWLVFVAGSILVAVVLSILILYSSHLRDTQTRIRTLQVYQDIFANNDIPQIILAGATGVIVQANSRACAFFAIDPTISSPPRYVDLCTSQEALLPPVGLSEAPLKDASGVERPTMLFCWLVELEQGQPCLHVLLVDLTKQKTLEADRAYMEKELVHASRLASVGTLAAGIAHEINNPLTVIKGFNWSLRQRLENLSDNKEILNLLSRQNQGIDRITQIVSRMKSLARTETEAAVPVDPIQAIADTVDFVREMFVSQGITIEFSTPGGLPTILGVPLLLQQVFLNILTNARDALSERDAPLIRIRAAEARDGVEIVFTDNGPGIDKNTLTHIFDPFFTTKGPAQGTGLGLSITHDLITQMHGRISVDSTVDQGTSFTIWLPRMT